MRAIEDQEYSIWISDKTVGGYHLMMRRPWSMEPGVSMDVINDGIER
jgi:hypothetical protein